VSAVTDWVHENVCATTAQKSCTCTDTCREGQTVRILVQHDQKPTETSWSLYTIDGTWIGQQNQGDVTTPMQWITKSFTLSPGVYKLTIGDSGKNGICCSFGRGYFSVASGSMISKVFYRNNGRFGASTEYKFAVVPNNANSVLSTVVVLHDNHPEETSWTLRNNAGNLLLAERKGSVTTPGSFVAESTSLTTGGYRFFVGDSGVNGICCNHGRGYFSLDVDQHAVHT
jgi:hypothetical protein